MRVTLLSIIPLDYYTLSIIMTLQTTGHSPFVRYMTIGLLDSKSYILKQTRR